MALFEILFKCLYHNRVANISIQFNYVAMLNQTEFSRHYYDTTATLDEWGA
jgi:hypothetical protein